MTTIEQVPDSEVLDADRWHPDALEAQWARLDAAADRERWPRDVISDVIHTLTGLEPADTPAEQINRIAALEQLIAAAHGVLAAEEIAFATQQRAQQSATASRPGTSDGASPNRSASPAASHPSPPPTTSATPTP